jgi:carboxypeptidase C (cathepsin A)
MITTSGPKTQLVSPPSERKKVFMIRSALRVSVAATFLALGLSAFGQAPAAERGAERSAPKPDENTVPIPPETSSVTKHDWTAGGQTIHYTATAGNLLIKDDKDQPNGSIFYVAYTQDGVEAGTRPLTFFYNGGPGSATAYLHMGSFGPIRVVTSSPEATGPPPFQVVPNQYSLIDKTDLVFIDAPLAGFSRAVGKGTIKDFAGVDEDVKAFEKFIMRYITLNQRWNSPKFLFGESYGTPRSAALVAALENDSVEFNGVTLLSSILNYNVRAPGYDTSFTTYLPSYTAIAYHYNKGKHTGTLPEAVQQAREFARGPYAEALAQGDKLPAAQFDAIAQKLSDFTGLSVQYLKQSRLRVSPPRFRKELLRGDDRMLGRYDARFEGWDADDAGETPGYDPSGTGIEGAYVGALHEYLQKDLKYMSTDTYFLTAPGVNRAWNFKHHASGEMGDRLQDQPDTAIDLADAMRKNPKLRVFSANGWFDLATPFFGTEYDLSHMMLPPSIASNVEFGYYPAGHMVYLNVDALKQMKSDLNRFYGEALAK